MLVPEQAISGEIERSQNGAVDKAHILLYIEGDQSLAVRTMRCLNDASYQVDLCRTFDEAVSWICQRRNEQPDAILIDVPSERSSRSMNAFKLYGFVRNGGWAPGIEQRFTGWGDAVSTLMLVDEDHRIDTEERMYALSVHPDKIDYKPYKESILISKIQTLIQKPEESDSMPDNAVLRIRSLAIDPAAETVTLHGNAIKLSQLEYRLLYYLVSNTDIPLTRETLLEDIWGITGAKAVNNRNVDVYIGRLRKKLNGSDCADLIGRGRNGTYLIESYSIADVRTEPLGNSSPITQLVSPARATAELIREGKESHLPKSFPLQDFHHGRQVQTGIKIGRNSAQSDCIILDKRVSRWHATIFMDKDSFFIRDENSTGHTFILRDEGLGKRRKRRLRPREYAGLEDGDIIYFNTIAYRFSLTSK